MKKILFTLLISFSLLMFNSCSKTDMKSVNNSASDQNLSQTLYNSSEYASYVAATNNIISSIDFNKLQAANTESARAATPSNKEYLTKSEVQKILNTLPIKQDIYLTNREVLVNSIQSFQKKYHLTNEQSASLWNNVINSHSESFKPSFDFPIITGIINCVTDAATTFAATTAVCLALRQIPFIGEKLFRICETEAINTLTDSLLGCIQL